MALRDALLALLTDLGRFRATLLDRAAAHADTVMPGYTHSQHAQPITLGYYLLAFADSLARDCARLRGALERVDACPLGAGALATTGPEEHTSELQPLMRNPYAVFCLTK